MIDLRTPANLLVAKIAGRVMRADEVAALSAALPEWRVSAYGGVDAPETYVYIEPTPAGALPAEAWAHPLAQIRQALSQVASQVQAQEGADASPEAAQAVAPALVLLGVVQDIPGASAGRDAAWHYIVETDVVAEQDEALNDWYNREHLPGLASVPGTVRARRFVCEQGGPRYHACYDLETRETFGSLPWLAVRATDWSSQVRPAFRNTKRTMFKRIGELG
ncbi:hypothetical protein RBI14_22865 [Alcaligenaceae bacterium B3P038]|nr:hypothetical protein [Alcaligenaceae bacterium B3P038]